MKSTLAVLLLFSLNELFLFAGTATTADTHGKFILDFGGMPASAGGTPTPLDLTANVDLLRKLPVDGLVINLTNATGYFADSIFSAPAPTPQQVLPDVEAYIKLRRGTGHANHDFIRIDTAALTADWYDDKAWEQFLRNFEFLGQSMAKMGIRGIFLDTEAYNETPFNYKMQIRRTEFTFVEYCAQVRHRGRQVGATLARSVPDAVMMLTYGPCIAHREKGKSNLEENLMGLLPAFLRGVQEGALRMTMIDGYEGAYTFRKHSEFEEARHWMTSAKGNSFPGFNGKHHDLRAGFGLWLHKTKGTEKSLDAQDFKNNSHTPQEWEHALHYALRNADSHIWAYAVPWKTLPQEYWQAFAAARQPHALDFKPLTRPEESGPAAYICSAKGRPDAVDKYVFAPFYRTHVELFDFPKVWKFRLDPQSVGGKEKWYKPDLTLERWQDLRIDDWWEPQLNRNYWGDAWYRVTFTPPSSWTGRPLLLAFGAVDEDAFVYLNGKPLGTHVFGADGWNTPFEFGLNDRLRWDKSNVLAVRVVNKVGVGGIWKSVKIFSRKRTSNLRPHSRITSHYGGESV